MRAVGRFLTAGIRGLCCWVARAMLLGLLFVILAGFGILTMVFFAEDVILETSSSKEPVVNVSVRHATADRDTVLSWAPEEVFAFVRYYRQNTTPYERWRVGGWTRQLVDAALALGGRHYLPYQVHATWDQFVKGYPRFPEYAALKNRLDPQNRFRNALWDAYVAPTPDRVLREVVNALPKYYRPEEQTFLVLSEWDLVAASNEVARQASAGPASKVKYFSLIYDFGRTYAVVVKLSRRYYPTNWSYHFMNTVIGLHTTVEYVVKGAYEATVDRLTEWWDGPAQLGPPSPDSIEALAARQAAEYAHFIRQQPWYLYPFNRDLKEVLNLPKPPATSKFRHWERKFATVVEYAIKGGLGKLFAVATGTIYAPEEGRIGMVLTTSAPLQNVGDVRVERTISEGVILVSVPRYAAFSRAAKDLASQSGVEIKEIAGNPRIALFGEDGEFCRLVEDRFRSTVSREVEIVTHQLFQPGDTDFRTQLLRIRKLAPEDIVVCAWRDGDLVMRQIADSGMIGTPTHHYAAPLLPTADAPEIRQLYERNRSTSTWYGFVEDEPNNAQRELALRFKAAFGVTPIFPDAGYAYDDIWVIKHALEPCLQKGEAPDQECLARNVLRTNYDGISGNLKFSEQRVSQRPVIGMRVSNGKWVPLDAAPVSTTVKSAQHP